MDFVPNHTSDRHPWFQSSRAARNNPKRDWYVWHDPGPNGGPPNNWLSRFGGSAWTLDRTTGQYYYHAFLEQQPDLNWRNPEVRRAMANVLRFWMKRGVDGFRVDASAVLLEDALLRNDPPNPDWDSGTPPPERLKRVFSDGRTETLGCLAELREVVDEFSDRVLLGEVQGAIGRVGRFYEYRERPLLHLPLNFALLDVPWDVDSIAGVMDQYLAALPRGGWPDWVIGSHDKCRIATRVGTPQARVAAMLLFTLPGTPVLYAGDEIGLQNVPIPSDQAKDPFERLVPCYGLNRDPERSPMRWDGTQHAGFTRGRPWLPVGQGVEDCNVEAQRRDPHSMLALYRRLIRLRHDSPALSEGTFEPARSVDNTLVYLRRCGSEEVRVFLNIGDTIQHISVPDYSRTLLSTYLDRAETPVARRLELRPNEGAILSTT
jgi:alpha-glucosidase